MNDFWSGNRDARFLITGASGWFGRTLADQLIRENIPFMCLGSHNRSEVFSNKAIEIFSYGDSEVLDFAPTVLADFAFLTRDKSQNMSAREYARTNRQLTNQALSLGKLDSVHTLITASSGASTHGSPDPYGQLKLEADERFREEVARSGKSWVNIRAWSVTGPFVRNVRGYAFSNLVHNAVFEGKIVIENPSMVFRRYVDVGDLIQVASRLALARVFSGTLDSGGELVELEQLAHRIFGMLEVEPKIELHRPGIGVIDDYFSRSSQWENTCRKIGYEPKNLNDQIASLIERFSSEISR